MKTIKDEFCSFEIAKELKDLGFNEMVIATYDEDQEFDLQNFEQNYETFPNHIIGVPLYQQIIEWFREKHDICIMVSRSYYFDTYINSYTYTAIFHKYENKELRSIHRVRDSDNNDIFYSYNKAREAAIWKCIELIKNK